jgi:hypothetical protein
LLGVFVRLLAKELADGVGRGRDELESAIAQAIAFRDQWLAALEMDLDYKVIPIKSLVSIQLGAALHTARYVRDAGK